jgi:uncharacterized GH25 family protein
MTIKQLLMLFVSLSMLLALAVYGISSPNIFQGKVLSPKGEPIEGASIRINHLDEIIALTNKTGAFEFQTDRLVFSIEARSSLYPTYRGIWFPENNQDQFVLLVLKKPFDFQGRVTDKNNKPIKTATIKVYSAGYFSQTGFNLITTLTADTSGKFLIKDLVPDNQYQVEVSADYYQTFKTDTLIAGRNFIPELAWVKLDSNIKVSSVSDIRPTAAVRTAVPESRLSSVARVPDQSYWRSKAQQNPYPVSKIPSLSSISKPYAVPRATAKPNMVSEMGPGDSFKNQVTIIVTDTADKPIAGTKVMVAGKTMVTDTTGRIEFTPARLGEININVNYNNVWYSKSYNISHPNDVIRIRVGTIDNPKPKYVPSASSVYSNPSIKYDPTNGTTTNCPPLWRRGP